MWGRDPKNITKAQKVTWNALRSPPAGRIRSVVQCEIVLRFIIIVFVLLRAMQLRNARYSFERLDFVQAEIATATLRDMRQPDFGEVSNQTSILGIRKKVWRDCPTPSASRWGDLFAPYSSSLGWWGHKSQIMV